MKYKINGIEYTLNELNGILSGIGENITLELQDAALEIMESLEA